MAVGPSTDRGMSFFGDWDAYWRPEPDSAPVLASRATLNDSRSGSASGGDTPSKPRIATPRRYAAAGLAIAALTATVAAVLGMGSASADPSASTWLRLRQCESSDNYAINTGNAHYGAYQFDLTTWRSVGGTGYPSNASAAEQDARALILYRERGWQPWQCATILGLREDADARSGRISDIKVPTTGSGPVSAPAAGIPAFPGPRWFHYGDWNDTIKRFQDQMHARGFFPVGTGQYGPHTLAMVERLQALNGLIPNGELGPNTWRLAWTGKYS